MRSNLADGTAIHPACLCKIPFFKMRPDYYFCGWSQIWLCSRVYMMDGLRCQSQDLEERQHPHSLLSPL